MNFPLFSCPFRSESYSQGQIKSDDNILLRLRLTYRINGAVYEANRFMDGVTRNVPGRNIGLISP